MWAPGQPMLMYLNSLQLHPLSGVETTALVFSHGNIIVLFVFFRVPKQGHSFVETDDCGSFVLKKPTHLPSGNAQSFHTQRLHSQSAP